MKILIVIGDYFNYSNGMSISTQRFVEAFKELGHEVRVLASDAGGKSEYSVPVLKIPFVNGVIEKQNYHFAKPVKKVMEEAIRWADVVHIEDPFLLCAKTAKLARKMGKPVTGTFHLYPENMIAAFLGLDHEIINGITMRIFRDMAYRHCNIIQCPAPKVKKRLEEYKFKGKLFVASNGISKDYIETEPSGNKGDIFTLLSIGRYANEKDQATLLKALKLCKHESEIQLVLAGHGPCEKKLRKLAEGLTNPPVFDFYSQAGLKEVIDSAHLYVHCAVVEIEGMSCMEAFSHGAVPIIADAKLSSTSEYALTEMNRFKAFEYETLAKRIDYWFENRDELERMSGKYMDFAKTVSVEASAKKFMDIIEEQFTGKFTEAGSKENKSVAV